MNLCRGRKSGCEISIDHHEKICKITKYITYCQVTMRWLQNVVKEEDISEYRLQREDYWIKILRNPYHDLNQKTKFTN